MRVLITGGQGQLGRSLQERLSGDVVFAPGHGELDITDAAAVQRAIDVARPDAVIHAAAWTDTAGCESDPDRAMRINGEGSRIVAEECNRVEAPVAYISSNEVFDGENQKPYREDDPPLPINAYGRSKLAGEDAVRLATSRHYVVRTSWLYGPGRTSFPEKVLRAAEDSDTLKGVTDEVASPTWTADLAGGVIELLRQRAPFGVYHLTNDGHCSRLEWMREILRLKGLSYKRIEPATLSEFGAPYRKPAFSALANVRAAGLGIGLRPWQEALQEHLRSVERGHPTQPWTPGVNR